MDQSNNTTKAIKDSIKVIDTTAIINNAKTVILVQEKAKDPVIKETDWMGSFFIPLIIVFVGGLFSYFMNKRRTDVEIKKIKGETLKTDVEIQKLITENEKLKKSFQPIVIGTLQSVQEHILTIKLAALKELIRLKADFVFFEQIFDEEGDPYYGHNDNIFLKQVFLNFGPRKFDETKVFHETYSYIFPDIVLEILRKLFLIIKVHNEEVNYFHMNNDGESGPTGKDIQRIQDILELFDQAVLAIRKDCHLDTSFIHDFIEQNK
jgi:hypothetical protein